MAFSYSLALKNAFFGSKGWSDIFRSQVKTITASVSTNVVTATCSSHGFQVGDVVKVEGATPSGINGNVTILTVPTANTFTYAATAVDGAATGTITATLAFTIEVRSGTRPTTADSASTGTLLGIVTLNGDGVTGLNFDTPANGAIDKPSGAVWQFTGLAAGTATWLRFRLVEDDGSSSTNFKRIDGTLAAFGGDAILTDSNVTVGKVIVASLSKFTWP